MGEGEKEDPRFPGRGNWALKKKGKLRGTHNEHFLFLL